MVAFGQSFPLWMREQLAFHLRVEATGGGGSCIFKQCGADVLVLVVDHGWLYFVNFINCVMQENYAWLYIGSSTVLLHA
jgi:hypothetical protein